MTRHFPTYGQSIVLLLSIFLGGLIASIVVLPFFTIQSIIGMSLIYSISMLFAVGIGLLIRRNWRLKINAFPTVIIFILVVTMIAIQVILEPLQSFFPPPDFLVAMTKALHDQPFVLFFTIVIAAPFLEEILFRGIILDGFLKNYKTAHAILISALLFALIHGNLTQGTGALILGILLGWIYWKTDSIIPCILLHLINNGLAFFATFYATDQNSEKSLQDIINNDLLYVALYIISILVAIASVFFLLNTKDLHREKLPTEEAPNL